MIIFIEGCSGSGKTTLAEGLSRVLGIPICRGFRNQRTGKLEAEELAPIAAVMPIHKWWENIYAANIFCRLPRFKFDFIVDRALPSGLHHDSDEMDGDDRLNLLRWWGNRMKDRAIIIELLVDSSVAFERCNGTFSPEFLELEANSISLFCSASKIITHPIDVRGKTSWEVLDSVLKVIRHMTGGKECRPSTT